MVESSSFNGESVNNLFNVVVIICSALCLFILSRAGEQALLPAYMYCVTATLTVPGRVRFLTVCYRRAYPRQYYVCRRDAYTYVKTVDGVEEV